MTTRDSALANRPAPSGQRLTGRLILGGVLIVLGLVFLLDNFGILDSDQILQFWPLILIGVGLWKAMRPREDGQRGFGFVLAAVGAALQLQLLGITDWSIRVAWPVVLVAIGALLLWRGLGRGRARGSRASAAGQLSEFAFMGGGNRLIATPAFSGGDVTAIMGGLEIDLRKSAIAGEEAVIDVFALWGGIEIRVPAEWSVDVKGIAILGGFENNARDSAVEGMAGKRLVIQGTALMGGVEIKN